MTTLEVFILAAILIVFFGIIVSAAQHARTDDQP